LKNVWFLKKFRSVAGAR